MIGFMAGAAMNGSVLTLRPGAPQTPASRSFTEATMSSTAGSMAAVIGGIRTAQPGISAAAIEALLHIADGADHAAELQHRMDLGRSTINRSVNLLTGRGSLGRRARASRLRLVDRRKHPHRRGAQLVLSVEGQRLLALVDHG